MRLLCFAPVDSEWQEETGVITENQFLEVLTEQAREIAKNVLTLDPNAGTDLASDAMV